MYFLNKYILEYKYYLMHKYIKESISSVSSSVSPSFWLLAVTFIFLMFYSLRPWFLWSIRGVIVDIIASLILILYYIYDGNIERRCNSKYKYVIIFYVLLVLWNYYIENGGAFLPFLFALLATDNEKERILSWWTNFYAIVLAITLIAWLSTFVGALPSHGTIIADESINHIYTNYWLCTKGFIYPFRFHSVFLEPGHTAMIGAFTLYANKYQFKKPAVIVILICCLFTLSLVGYILIPLGYAIVKMLNSSYFVVFKNLMLSCIIFASIILCGLYYNGGNNHLNEFILERLELDDEKGIVGNNRTSDYTDLLFDRSIKNGNAIWGMSQQRYKQLRFSDDIHGAGYKIYILQKGIVGTVLIFFFYFFLYRTSREKSFALGLFILYILSFIQRAYPFWYSMLFIFLFVTSLPNRKNSIALEK